MTASEAAAIIRTFRLDESMAPLETREMGKGIYGAEAASEYYFHKHAKDLSPSEAASIAAILPDPLKWSASNQSPYVASRTAAILNQMRLFGGRLDYNMKE